MVNVFLPQIPSWEKWGQVSVNLFNNQSAAVVCRQMGMQGGRVHTPQERGWIGAMIWVDDVLCEGTEASLDQCAFRGYGMNLREPFSGGSQQNAAHVCCEKVQPGLCFG